MDKNARGVFEQRLRWPRRGEPQNAANTARPERYVRNPEYAKAPRSGDEAGRKPGVKRARRLYKPGT